MVDFCLILLLGAANLHDHGQKSPVELERTDPARYRYLGRDPPPPDSMLDPTEHRGRSARTAGAPTLNGGEGDRVLGGDSARGPCAPEAKIPPAIFDHGLKVAGIVQFEIACLDRSYVLFDADIRVQREILG